MKNFITTAFLILIINSIYAQINLPYSVDFNSGIPLDWTQNSDFSNAPVTWTYNSNLGIGNTGCVFTDLGDTTYNGRGWPGSGWLQTPFLDLTSVSNPILSYKYAITRSFSQSSNWELGPPAFSFWYDIGAGWQFIENYAWDQQSKDTIMPLDAVNVNWIQITKNLSAFSNFTNIRFSFGADYADSNLFVHNVTGWVLLDDVQFTSGGSTAGIEEEANTYSVNIYPNPSDNVIHIDSDVQVEKYSVSNLLGQTILEGNIMNNIIDISSLEKNVYFVSVMDVNNKKVMTKKISKL